MELGPNRTVGILDEREVSAGKCARCGRDTWDRAVWVEGTGTVCSRCRPSRRQTASQLGHQRRLQREAEWTSRELLAALDRALARLPDPSNIQGDARRLTRDEVARAFPGVPISPDYGTARASGAYPSPTVAAQWQGKARLRKPWKDAGLAGRASVP
jgi:hypothetical protein